ncbi:hypothetical protein ACFX2C_024382 [Malus domestica]
MSFSSRMTWRLKEGHCERLQPADSVGIGSLPPELGARGKKGTHGEDGAWMKWGWRRRKTEMKPRMKWGRKGLNMYTELASVKTDTRF